MTERPGAGIPANAADPRSRREWMPEPRSAEEITAILAKRAEELARVEDTEAAPSIPFLHFSRGRHHFAIAPESLSGVVRDCPVSRLPRAHRGVSGVFMWRGESMLAIDLPAILSSVPVQSGPIPNLIILSKQVGRGALAADTIQGIVQIDPAQWSPLPKHQYQHLQDCVNGVIEGGAMIIDARALMRRIHLRPGEDADFTSTRVASDD